MTDVTTPAAPSDTIPTALQVRERIHEVIHPAIGIGIVDLGLVYDVRVDDQTNRDDHDDDDANVLPLELLLGRRQRSPRPRRARAPCPGPSQPRPPRPKPRAWHDHSPSDPLHASGHRSTPVSRSPFGPTAPTIAAAMGYAIAAGVWVVVGTELPGGRWLAVHLFTLGVLTNLILVFSDHFGRTVTRSADEHGRWPLVGINAGILAVLIGITTAITWAVAVGASVVTGGVFLSYWRLRRMRKAAVGARFNWIARIYERAHGAFIHGAVLGLLLGVGALSGSWYAAGRLAHMHVNVLGWAGLTLLATLVFFGPTIVRTRIVPGADERGAHALRQGATGLTVGVVLLLATGVGGDAGTIIRVLAAAAIALFARAATITCVDVVKAARRAKPSATRWSVVALSLWFPLVAWADVAVIATAAWRFLDAVGLAMLLGVLGQTVATVLSYLAPMLRGRSFAGRDRLHARFERGSTVRTLAYNAGVMAVVVAAAALGGAFGAVVAYVGWALIIGALASLLIAAIAPTAVADETAAPVSQVARRHRSTDDG